LDACAAVLKNRGRLWLCFPASRMPELMNALRVNRLEPKRIRAVCASTDKAPYLLLIEAVKNAAPGLSWLPVLIVMDETGRETEEIKAIYGLKTDECPREASETDGVSKRRDEERPNA
jgi:tRNA1Val (adenine37-N6)-methyltransferase